MPGKHGWLAACPHPPAWDALKQGTICMGKLWRHEASSQLQAMQLPPSRVV